MALFNYHQRFVLLSNELETKCNEERESKIRLFYTQQEVESLRAARPHMTHFSQQVSPRTPVLYESVAMMKIAKNYLALFTTTSSLFTPLIKPLIPTLNYITPLCPLASIPPTMPQSEALDRTPTKILRQESHVISVKENTPIARQWSEGRIDLLENYCRAVFPCYPPIPTIILYLFIFSFLFWSFFFLFLFFPFSYNVFYLYFIFFFLFFHV